MRTNLLIGTRAIVQSRLLFLLACFVFSVPGYSAERVSKTDIIKNNDGQQSTVQAVCKSLTTEAYPNVVSARPDDGSVLCKVGDGKPEDDTEQHTGSIEKNCPPDSKEVPGGQCECNQGLSALGGKCVSSKNQTADSGHEKPSQVEKPPLLVQVEIKPVTGEAGGWRQLEQPTRSSYGAIGIITEGGGNEGVATYDRLTGKVELKVSPIGEGSSAGKIYQIGQIPPSELADITAKSGGNPNKFGNLAEAPIRKLISDATGQAVLDPGKSASKTGVDWRPQQPPLPFVK